MTEPGNPALHRMLMDVPVRVEVVLGEMRLTMEELSALTPGEVLTMEKQTGEPVDIYVSGRLIARGKLVVADGELGVTLTEIVDARTVN
ncbi:MAG: flagellar motor switch protein FliN [Hyphomonas sp.]|uniref:flagellar motor switch protein FliN n=1 Tax=Hyphomonas sp. TaxID=87 RepID=UPI00181B1427|nr:flagellar motor switch protein FliN [Hyphomonas sp.]MBA3069182.1 flagellar motor switch protein FliN [Hyphomonas sp.]MBU3919692.1 flagellar motor switch protein FliN [Alphaproteobacteria bacterium]MBU4062367.1 flagellar motor switch protein FliN [Alphaproteobacteria bacterium]MBU4162749.1 flagellar motor switch protein FliN [Alphaproteobacteria bacterium]